MIKLVTAATTRPFDESDVKTHLNLPQTYTDQDAYFLSLIDIAVDYCLKKTELQLLEATYNLFLDQFQTPISCIRGPLLSVESLKYYNQSGDLTTLVENTDYLVDKTSMPWRITPVYAGSWPSVQKRMNAVQIEFKAGYSAAAAIPPNIIAGLKLHIGDLWKNRETIVIGRSVNQAPLTVDKLYELERVNTY